MGALLIRRTKRIQKDAETDYDQKEVDTEAWKRHRAELDDSATSRKELATGAEAHELVESHGVTEVTGEEIREYHEMPA